MITETQRPSFIRVIAVCVFRCEDRILVFEGFDRVKRTPYYRPLGGGVEPGETSAETVKREILEELAQKVRNVRLLGTLENLFTLDGTPMHEVVFVHDGDFVDPAVYAQARLTGVEDNGDPLTASWRPLDFFDDHHRLVPEGLAELLKRATARSCRP